MCRRPGCKSQPYAVLPVLQDGPAGRRDDPAYHRGGQCSAHHGTDPASEASRWQEFRGQDPRAKPCRSAWWAFENPRISLQFLSFGRFPAVSGLVSQRECVALFQRPICVSARHFLHFFVTLLRLTKVVRTRAFQRELSADMGPMPGRGHGAWQCRRCQDRANGAGRGGNRAFDMRNCI